MTITVGSRLGPYEILGRLGSGGMGEVYRASDTRLNRDVAIKVLAPGVADNPTRRARFEREAHAIAQLSHPNICAIYDIGEIDGAKYFVMEYIEGESLDQRLRRGPLPWPVAVSFAIQIAAGLEAAHKRGIIHRDLKPANVMINESGVKLLDFGLAKLIDLDEPPAQAPSPLETVTVSLTAEQKIVGTIHYMAPEQLEVRPVDVRTDIFAFGTTVYEMLTARRAFDGASAASITASILRSEPPPITTSPPGAPVAPQALEHVIRRAIAKDPADRWQSARDVMVELRSVQDERAASPRALSSWGRGRWATAFLIGAAAFTMAGMVVAWSLESPTPQEAPLVFEVFAPPDTTLDSRHTSVNVSPNGRRILFAAVPVGSDLPSLYLRDLDIAETRAIPRTEGAASAFWSPDSRSVAFFSTRQQVVRVDIGDGTQQVLCDLPSGFNWGAQAGVWLDDGTILVLDGSDLFRLWATPPGPLRPEPPTKVSDTHGGWFADVLPGGRDILMFQGWPTGKPRNAVWSVDSKQLVELPSVTSKAMYADDHLVFLNGDSQLVAQRFDEKTLKLMEEPVALISNAHFRTFSSDFSVGGGTLAYRSPTSNHLVWRNRRGDELGYVGETDRAFNPAIAHDGSDRVSFDLHDPAGLQFTIATSLEQGQTTRSITHRSKDRFPVWSPDGQWIAYSQAYPDNALMRVSSDGKREEMLLRGKWMTPMTPLDWSPDGRYLLYSTDDRSGIGIWALEVPPPGEPLQKDPFRVVALESIFLLTGPAASFSPDGKWIANTSETGLQIWVRRFPTGEDAVQVSQWGINPVWSRDGTNLFFETSDGKIMSAPVTPGRALTIGRPQLVFQSRARHVEFQQPHPFAVSADGQRFLVNEPVEEPDRITVVVHWTSLLHPKPQ